MVDKSDSSVIKTAWKKPLANPLPYSWAWREFADVADFLANGVKLTDQEQMDFRNTQAEGKARSAAQTATLNAEVEAGRLVKPTAANDNQIAMLAALKPMLVATLPDGSRKFTDEQARAKVEELWGEKFED